MKLIYKTSTLYGKRLAREINKLRYKSFPTYRNVDSKFDGRRIQNASVIDGILTGRSLNGESFPLNVEGIFDYNGEQIVASREP